jgi:long-chain acyl-CoA synthetase
MTKALDFRILESWWRHSSNGKKGNGGGNTPVAIDPPWVTQLDRAGIPRHLNSPTTTLARVLDQTADRFHDAPALIYADKQCTYGELLARVNRMAGGLAGLGLRKGDRVLLTLPNCPEFVVSFFAIQKLGAVAVNVGPLMGADDLEKVIALTTPKVTIALDLQSPLIMKAAHGSTVQHSVWVSLQLYQPVLKRVGYQFKLWHRPSSNGEKITHHPLNDLLATAAARPPTIEPEANEIAVLQATGGTTGTLKLVQLSHRNLLCNAAQMGVWIGSRIGQERHLAVLPMFHVYGLTTGLLCSVYHGSCMVMATRFHPRETIEMIRRHKPTVLLLVPAILHSLSDFLEKDTSASSKLEGAQLCVSGAAPLPTDVGERFTKLTGVPCIEGYGLTEAGPVTHVNLPKDARLGSIGLPLSDTKVRVVDLEVGVRDVLPGEPGELLISGPQIMSGYFGNPKETDRVLWTDEHGVKWLRTGDVARYDADGFFYICDRKKDMIIRSGMKVYPAKVEAALKKHEAVADVAVIGKPDPVHTELVIAYIVRKDSEGLPRGLSDELRGYCRQHLAPYEVPAAFEFIDQIPRSPLGKVLKRDLRKLAETPKTLAPESTEKETA